MSHIDTLLIPFETCSLDAGRTEGKPYARIYPTKKLSRDLFFDHVTRCWLCVFYVASYHMKLYKILLITVP
jgi:hypothetical protein